MTNIQFQDLSGSSDSIRNFTEILSNKIDRMLVRAISEFVNKEGHNSAFLLNKQFIFTALMEAIKQYEEEWGDD